MKHSTLLLISILISLTVASCSPEKSPPMPASHAAASSMKNAANTDYRTQMPYGSAPRNPDLGLPSNFSKSSGVTFSRVSVPGPYVALTFDDGPHASNTPRLLDILRARNVKATFYVIGKNVDLYPNIVRRTVAEGHELGNHTYTHPKLSALGQDRVFSEIRKCDDAIMRAAGVRPRTLRPPYGALTQAQRVSIHSTFGYPTIMWAVDPLDWKRPGVSVVTSRIVSATSNGSIILVHDLHASSVDAMPATIDALLRKGYKFVTVSQLLAMSGSASASINPQPSALAQSQVGE
jgi:peptidoglycan/xylan/chitin deacetylase (PgdA/CDA1 family)